MDSLKRKTFPFRQVTLGIGALLLLAGCSAAAPAPKLAAASCAAANGFVPPMGLLPGMPKIYMAKHIAPSDTSTSTVIKPDPADQIVCGTAPLLSVKSVVYSTPILPNGKSDRLEMDVLVPSGGGKKPLVIHVPGGGFMVAMKESGADLRTYVAEQGFVVASIHYRVVKDGATWKDSIIDVKSAIRYLRAHADVYGIDADHVAIWGESAGGYLVAMTGVTNGMAEFDIGENLNQSSQVQAVIDKFGTSDTSRLTADFEPEAQAELAAGTPMAHFFNGADSQKGVVDGQIAATTANALTYVDAQDPPFLLFHGSGDQLISPSQTLMLHNALKAAGVDSTRYVLDGANHGDMAFMGNKQAGLPWSSRQTMTIMVDFLKRTLTPAAAVK